MKSNLNVFPFYAVTAMLIALASFGCELQHADGTTGSDDGSAAETGQEDDQVEADSNDGFLGKAQDLLGQAKEFGQETASEAGEWMNGAVGSAKDSANGTSQWITDTYNSLHEKGLTSAKDAQQWVQDDFRNMNAFEYKILPKSQTSPESLEATLNELGQERWDCFEVDAGAFYFKRQKKSYLRNIPLKDLIRFFPGGGGE